MSLANRIAIASPLVSAMTVEANEFPELSRRFGVRGVPHTVVNRKGSFVGAMPEDMFVASIFEAAGVALDEDSGPDE